MKSHEQGEEDEARYYVLWHLQKNFSFVDYQRMFKKHGEARRGAAEIGG